MRVKSYYAGTVESAIRLARKELGDDAMLMNSRPAPPEARHMGLYEVVFAAPQAPPGQPDHADAPAPPETPAAAPAAPAAAPPSGLVEEVAAMRRQLERMMTAVSRSNSMLAGRLLVHPEVASVFSALTASEVDPELAFEIARQLEPVAAADPVSSVTQLLSQVRRDGGLDTKPRPGAILRSAALQRALAEDLASRFQVDSELGRAGTSPKVVAFAGPPGSGKTTSLVKLALTHGVTARKPVQLLSMDNYRIAGCEQLRSYAAILGVGFQALETTVALGQSLEEHRHKDLILIDTPGYSQNDLEMTAEMARFFAAHPGIETHLVLSCSTKSADLSRMVDRYAVFKPAKLLFTRLDETETYGPILNEAVRTRLPVSFLSTGQQIPEDIHPATKARLIEMILRGRMSRAAVAAR